MDYHGIRLRSVRALFFDFDGTMLDTEAAAGQAWRDEFAAYGVPFPEALRRSLLGSPNSQEVLLARLASALPPGVPPPAIGSWRRRQDALVEQLPVPDGLMDLLVAAKARGWVLAVTSGATGDWVLGHLRRLRLVDFFDTVVTGEGLGPKPSPDIYLEALRRCRLPATRALAFEDSRAGQAAARAAGIACLPVQAGGLSTSDAHFVHLARLLAPRGRPRR